VNLDGGAIALGHPLGASGARIVGKAAQLLKRTAGAMRWRRSASAAGRASPPCWRRSDGRARRRGGDHGAAVVEGELRGMAAPSGRAPTVRGAIRKVGVVGAGVMGAGIAAHAANAGVPVVLLDIVPGAAAKAVQAMLKADPAPFMHGRAARLVSTGDLDADLTLLADCDWIVEAIVERPDAKRALYARLDGVRKPGSVVSSNTSTIPLRALVEGLPDGLAADFLITHFFNPPRYMRLLEVVAGPRRGRRRWPP
jgi:hypothetical protein